MRAGSTIGAVLAALCLGAPALAQQPGAAQADPASLAPLFAAACLQSPNLAAAQAT